MTGARPTPARKKAWLWWLAARPNTLLLSLTPVVLAAALAARDGHASAPIAWLAGLGAAAIQVGTNLFNDWGDARRGADAATRLGPQRMTQAGLIAARDVAVAGGLAFGVATLCGVGLLALGQLPWATLVALGSASLVAGYAYTNGPYPLAYHGLGELFAGVFFGPVAVGATYALAVGHVSLASAWLGAAVGAFAAAVLLINNVRDAAEDRLVHKHTLAVRLGLPVANQVLLTLLALPYLILMPLVVAGLLPPLSLSALATLPLAAGVVWRVRRRSGRALNGELAKTALVQLLYGLMVAVALVSVPC